MYFTENKDLNTIASLAGTSRQRLARWMQYWGLKRRSHKVAMNLKMIQKGRTRGPNWQGGRWWASSQKTWWVYAPHHPKARHHGGVPEHILVAEKRIGRPLTDNEVVHHLDMDRDNNDEKNLCVMSARNHQIIHIGLGFVGIQLILTQPEMVIQACKEPLKNLVEQAYIQQQPIVI